MAFKQQAIEKRPPHFKGNEDFQRKGVNEMQTYEELYDSFSWESFCLEHLDWNPKERLNITHEAVDRHAQNPLKIALFHIQKDGFCEKITYRGLQKLINRFANVLTGLGGCPTIHDYKKLGILKLRPDSRLSRLF